MAAAPRSWRMRFGAFFVRRWRRFARAWVTAPLPLRLKRLAALLLVFIFGIAGFPFRCSAPLLRDKQDLEPSPLHCGGAVEVRQIAQVVAKARQQLHSEVLPHDFASAKPDRRFDAVALLQEAGGVSQFHSVVGVADGKAEFDLLDSCGSVLSARLVPALAFLILVLAVVQDFADDRLGVGGHFHQVHSVFLGAAQRVFQRQNANLRAVRSNQADFGRGYLAIGSQFGLSFDAGAPCRPGAVVLG